MSAGLLSEGHGVMQALRERNVRIYVGAILIATCGMWASTITATVHMYEMTSSPFMVGLVGTAQFISPLVLAVWSGAISDRFDRRLVQMVGRAIAGSALLILAAAVEVGALQGESGPLLLLGAVLVCGVGLASSVPSMHALVPSIASPGNLESAIALTSSTPSLSRAIGPAAATLLLLSVGPSGGFALGAVGQFAFVFLLTRLDIEPLQASIRRPAVSGGFHYLFGDRVAGKLILAAVGLGFGTDVMITLSPVLAAGLSHGEEVGGLLASAFGAGAATTPLFIGALRRRLSLRALGPAGFAALALGLVFTGLASNVILASAGFVIAGAGLMVSTIALNSRLQLRIPDEVRGRVMAIWVLAFAGSRPLSALINGAAAETLSVRIALFGAAMIAILAGRLASVADIGLDERNKADGS